MNNHHRLLFAVLLPLLSGCASDPGGQIGWAPLGSSDSTVASQDFTSGVVSNINAGEADIVLTYDPAEKIEAKSGPGVIQPVPIAPLRQWVHIHIYWRPESRMSAGHPAAVNASLDWYILSGDDFKTGQWLYYGGAGYVLLSSNGRVKSVDIVEAEMEPRNRQGNMSDPIGRVRIHGRAWAVQNEGKLQDLMSQLQAVPKDPATPATRPATAPK